MADLEKIVKLIFEGDSSGLSQQINIAGKDFDKFSSNIQNATGPLADFGKKVALAEVALISLVGYGLVKAIEASSDFQAGFLEITTLVEATGESVDTFREDILNYAGDSVKSIEDINGAVYSAISAGVDYKDSLELLDTAEALSVAGKAELQDSLVALASTLNAYGASTDEAAQYADYLFTTVKLGQTTLPELNASLAQVTNIAAAAGVGFDEVAAAIAAITATGAPTADAITYIKGAITSILKPSSEAATAAERLGIDFNATALKSKGLAGVLDEVKIATGGNTEEMALLFGNVRGLNAALTLTGEGADKFKNALEEMKKSTGAVATAFEKMQEDVKLQLQNFYNNVDLVLINSGGRVKDGAADMVGGFTGIFKAINESIGEGTFDEIFDAINEFFGDTETLLKTIAKNLPEALAGVDFSGLVQSFEDLGEEIGEALDALFGGDLDLTSVEGLQEAIQKVVDMLTGLTNFTTGFIEGLNPLFIAIGEIAEKFGDMDEEGQKLAGNVSGWAQSINTLFKTLDALKGALGGIVAIVGFNQVVTFLTTLKTIATGGSIGVLGTSIDKLGTSVGGLVGAFAGLVGSGAIGWQVGTWLNSFEGVSSAAESFWAWTDQVLNWSGNADAVREAGKKFGTGFQDGVEDSFTEAASANYLDDFWAEAAETGNVEAAIDGVITKLEEIPKGEIGLNTEKIDSWEFYLDEHINPPTETLYDLLKIPGADDTLDIPVQFQLDKIQYEKDIAAIPDIEGRYSLDGTNWVDVVSEIDKNVPSKKIVEVKPTILEQAKLDLERDLAIIETSAENMQSAMEWTAKVDIAEVEAAAKTTEAAFDAVASSVSATAGAVSDMVTAFISGSNEMSQGDKWFAMDQIEAQLEMQEKALESQLKLNEAKTEEIRLRNEQIENGETSEIMISSDGLEPALEMIMWQIIEKVQIRANESAQEFLMGMPS